MVHYRQKQLRVLRINVTACHSHHNGHHHVTSPTIITRCFGVGLVPVLQLGYIDSETWLYTPEEHGHRKC